ncbi:uncharacterized protein BDW70DRAFT_77913 [Aspergillus foveolatus]|uniref:uncharacterized protein n=1 Tax=Aspergillus foveolatus TaxID=210207 RepID=UPI003CCCA1BB
MFDGTYRRSPWMINSSWTPTYPMVPSGQAQSLSIYSKIRDSSDFSFPFCPLVDLQEAKAIRILDVTRGPITAVRQVRRLARRQGPKRTMRSTFFSERRVPAYLSISSDQVSRVHSCSHGTTYLDPALYYSRVLWGQLLTFWRRSKSRLDLSLLPIARHSWGKMQLFADEIDSLTNKLLPGMHGCPQAWPD